MITSLRVMKYGDRFYLAIGKETIFGDAFQDEAQAEIVKKWVLSAMPKLVTKLGEKEVSEASIKGKNWQNWRSIK